MGIKLSSEYFIDQAMERTGGDDFGGRTFEEGLGALVHSLNTDVALSQVAAGYFSNQIIQLLVNRIEITRLVKEHPEILDEKIEKPVFITGLPRSGTSILHTLLALDPCARYLRNFETTGSICPPAELIPESMDPRIQAYHEAMEGVFAMAPVLRGINGINFMTHGPAECQNLMAHEFVNMGWSAGSSLFSHGNWVEGCDMQAAYQWHKLLLQVLQWKLPNERWILKAPMHLFGLDSLAATYPDARIVFIHRNPLEAMVSGVSMVYHWTRFTIGRADKQAIADWFPRLWTKGLEKAISIKNHLSDEQCLDVFHKRISRNQIKTVKAIYDHFGMDFSKITQKRMEIWLKDHPRSKFGAHVCTPKEFRLNPEKENEYFSFYTDQFDL